MAARPELPTRDDAATASPLDRHASPVADSERRTGRAVAAMVLGIISIPTAIIWFVSVPLGILAIVMGNIALTDARRSGFVNTGQAKAGIWCGIAGILLSIAIVAIYAATNSS
jgi:Domain of unknown function (DUF4190)